MTHLTYRDGIAILQIIIFGPCLLQAIFLCFRHGVSRAGGSLLLVSFMLTRLVGASCQLASIKHPSEGLLIAELVCLYIGLSPLTLVCWGVLQRVNKQMPKEIPAFLYKLTTVISLTGLALGIYGAVKASSNYTSGNKIRWTPYSKAAVIIFTVVFLITVAAFFFLALQTRSVVVVERRIFVAVLLSIPLIAVRLMYALVGEWSNSIRWNPYFGSATLYLCLAVLEEILVVLVMVITLSTVASFREMKREMDGFEKKRNVVA